MTWHEFFRLSKERQIEIIQDYGDYCFEAGTYTNVQDEGCCDDFIGYLDRKDYKDEAEFEDLNEMARNGRKLDVVNIIKGRSNVGLILTLDIVEYYIDNNLDLNELKNSAAIEEAIDKRQKEL